MKGIGIEVTPVHTILLELQRKDSFYRLGKTAILPGFQQDLTLPLDDFLGTDLAQNFKRLPSSIRKRATVFSLPSKHLLLHYTEIGADNPSAIRSLVRLEVDELSNTEEPMLSSYQRLYPPNHQSMIAIGVTRESFVEHATMLLRKSGLELQAFLPRPIALYECFLLSGDLEDSGSQMVINLDYEETDVVFVESGDLFFCRTLQFGIRDFVRNIGQQLGVNQEQAREMLLSQVNIEPGVAEENVSGERVVSAAQDSAAQLYMRLNGVFPFVRSRLGLPNFNVDKIVLTGAGAGIQGLGKFLGNRFQKSITFLNPLAGVDTSGIEEENLSLLQSYLPSLSLALGLAKWGADKESSKGLAFVSPSSLVRKNFFERSLWLYAGVLVLVFAFAYSIYASYRSSWQAQEVKLRQVQQAEAYNAFHRQLDMNQKYLNNSTVNVEEVFARMPELYRKLLSEEERLIELSEIQRPGLLATKLLAELGEELPSQVILRNYSLQDFMKQSTGETTRGVLLEIFIENGAEKAQVVYAKVQEVLRKQQQVAEIIPALLQVAADGSGSHAGVEVYLKSSEELLFREGEE